MTHWTEAAIAAELEGRFYGLNGKCRNEERQKLERERQQALTAARAQMQEQVERVIRKAGTHTATAIIAAVAHAHGVGPSDIVGGSRRRHIIHAKQHACFLMRELTGLSFQQVADAVGLVDHSTAHHSCVAWSKRGHVYAIEDKRARQMLGVDQ